MNQNLIALISVLILWSSSAICGTNGDSSSTTDELTSSYTNGIYLPLGDPVDGRGDGSQNSHVITDGGQLVRQQNFLELENLVTNFTLELLDEFTKRLDDEKKLLLLDDSVRRVKKAVYDLFHLHHKASYTLYDYIEKNYVLGPIVFSYMVARYVVMTTYMLANDYTWYMMTGTWLAMTATPDPEILAAVLIALSTQYKALRIQKKYQLTPNQIKRAQAEILDFSQAHRSHWHRVRVEDHIYIFPIALEWSLPFTLKPPGFWGRAIRVGELESKMSVSEARALKRMSSDDYSYEQLLLQKIMEGESREWLIDRIKNRSKFHNPYFAYLKSQQSEIQSDLRILSVNPLKFVGSFVFQKQRTLRRLRSQLRVILKELEELELKWVGEWRAESKEPTAEDFLTLQEFSQRRLDILLQIKDQSRRSHPRLFELIEMELFKKSCEAQF